MSETGAARLTETAKLKVALRVAIAGNPNSGKTSIFNNLTGMVHRVGNYPGVTVERKEGRFRLPDGRLALAIDLPGTYSLTAYSQEEVVARQAIIEERHDVVVDVVDATNLERNLYLVAQLLELQVPLVIALNMSDLAQGRGLKIDADRLSRLLGAPVVPTVGNRNRGTGELIAACAQIIARKPEPRVQPVNFGHEVEPEVEEVARLIARDPALAAKYPPRWLAVKLLEKDPVVQEAIKQATGEAEAILAQAQRAIAAIEKHTGEAAEIIIAERRYGFAAGAVRECVQLAGPARRQLTDRIDMVLCHRVLGIPFLLLIVYLMFKATWWLADEWAWLPAPWLEVGWLSPVALLEQLFGFLASTIAGLQAGAPALHSLLTDGVIGGVGAVISFLPLIWFMFAFIAVLEDSGYIARIAFLLDRVLRTFGLQGRCILALIVAGGLGGGGCAVPGCLATRTMREPSDRLLTMLVAPLMICGAKLPVFALLISAFFAAHRGEMMFLLTAISWGLLLLAALVLRKLAVKGPQTPFVMELPPYHVPTLKGVLIHAAERTWMYLKKAGTIVLAVAVVLWALMYFPRLSSAQERSFAGRPAAEREAAQLAGSFAGRLGRALEPVSRLAGLDWRDNIALVGGFAAKEVVIGTLGTAYSLGEVDSQRATTLAEHLQQEAQKAREGRLAPHEIPWTPRRAFALMLFVLLYSPCFATLVVIRKESGSWKWALFATAYTTAMAFALAVLVYQVGGALGWGE